MELLPTAQWGRLVATLTGRMSMSHMPMLVVTTWPTPSMVFPDRPCGRRGWTWDALSPSLGSPAPPMPHLWIRLQHAPALTDLDIGGVEQALWNAQALGTIVCVVAIGHLVVDCGHLCGYPGRKGKGYYRCSQK